MRFAQYKNGWGLIAIALLCSAWAMPAFAQSITVTQDLRFGNYIPYNNNSVHSVVIATDGGQTADPGLVPNGGTVQNGTLFLQGFAPFQAVTVSFLTDPATLDGGAGPDFTVDTFVMDPGASFLTDASGEATVDFGASLHTDGSGTRYSGGSYTGTITACVVID